MKRFFRQLHRIGYLTSVFLFFVLFYPVLWWGSQRKEPRYTLLVRLRRIVALLGSFAVGIFYRVRSQQKIDWSRTYIICANHTSNLDITAIMYACRSDFSFIGKEELLHNPITGLFFKTVDIPVNRSSKVSSFRAFKRAQDYLTAGTSVVIFPEGQIADVFPPCLQPFKNGVFKLAIDLQLPILPVIIHNAWKICWDDGKQRGTRPGIIDITLLPPIETKNSQKTDDELRHAVYMQMQSVTNDFQTTLMK